MIITDPYLCIEKNRKIAEERFESRGFEISWIFFENDVKACEANYARRSGGTSSDIAWFSKQYEIPVNVDTKPVWRKS